MSIQIDINRTYRAISTTNRLGVCKTVRLSAERFDDAVAKILAKGELIYQRDAGHYQVVTIADKITAELVRQGNEEPCPGLDEELDAIAADDTCVCPLCGDEFAAPAGVLVSDPADEGGALHLICPGCVAPDPDDLATPAQIAQRDAENAADMLDFLAGDDLDTTACDGCGERATIIDDRAGVVYCAACQARGERAAEDAAERQH